MTTYGLFFLNSNSGLNICSVVSAKWLNIGSITHVDWELWKLVLAYSKQVSAYFKSCRIELAIERHNGPSQDDTNKWYGKLKCSNL